MNDEQQAAAEVLQGVGRLTRAAATAKAEKLTDLKAAAVIHIGRVARENLHKLLGASAEAKGESEPAADPDDATGLEVQPAPAPEPPLAEAELAPQLDEHAGLRAD